MSQVYHFIRKSGEKGMCCNALQFFSPYQMNTKSSIDWGIESDGARILGYSILKDALGKEIAQENFEKLVNEVLSKLTLDEWKITKEQLSAFCDFHLQIEGATLGSLEKGMHRDNRNSVMPSRPDWIVDLNSSLAIVDENALVEN